MDKTAIKKFSVWARTKLISDITYRAGLLGVSEKGIAEPLPQSTKEVQFFDIGTANYAQVNGKEIAQRSSLVAAIKTKQGDGDYKTAFKFIVEEIAYTWFNRLTAIRFMEVNEYLSVRVLSSEMEGKNEPDLVTAPFDSDLEFNATEAEEILRLKDENKLDELFRMLFIKQCNALNAVLPRLFEKTNDYSELLLNVTFTDSEGLVYKLTHDIAEEDWQDQVQIIGWLYQYYISEKKDEVFTALKKNVKISKENIPVATQLFTPDWIVRYMVENSLGRLWVEGHPNAELKANWKYYLEEAEQEEEVQKQLEVIRKEYAELSPEDIKIIDPCCGSGHILAYIFDVLMQIYTSCGYSAKNAVKSILQNNLYALDIDERAAQLAYFAVMMKACEYDRRFLKRGVQPKVYAIAESNGVTEEQLAYFGSFLDELNRNVALTQIQGLLAQLHDAKEYGSILNVDAYDWDLLRAFVAEFKVGSGYNIFAVENIDKVQQQLQELVEVGKALAQKYDVVVTNPPYMGASGMNAKLATYVKDNYPDSKSDISTVFMEKTTDMCKKYGMMTMINIPVWMFLSSYENLRKKLLSVNNIINMVHPGRGIFGSDFGTVTFVFQKGVIIGFKGMYRKLFDVQGEVKSNEEREIALLNGKGSFVASQTNFPKIPGSPVAYWVSEKFVEAFKGNTVSFYCDARKGLSTGDNDKFLRLWYEVEIGKENFSLSEYKEPFRWIPINKGGTFRKWYGNNEYVINWYDNGKEIKQFAGSVIRNPNYYYRESITWTMLSASCFGVRFSPVGKIFEGAGPSLFMKSSGYMLYILGLLSSKLGNQYVRILNPTININIGDIANIPVLEAVNKEMIENIVKGNINISRKDWDSFETSWDFKKHPLVPTAIEMQEQRASQFATSRLEKFSHIEWHYKNWENECDRRFDSLKANEEELNRIFIDIYGLQDELTPEVEDKDVTVRKADLQREIKSLLSYAVGCMLGRYSLDVEGLAYAGGDWDASKYSTFIPDVDNALPITDEEYFGDDIIGLLCTWLKKVYGEETLEENLDFIANALGSSSGSSRDAIRNYFLKNFFADHCKIYQKRPIYWLFDSGKQNGFKVLVYMHRWNADTVGNVRVEYLHRLQRVYESEIQQAKNIIENSSNSREITAATKRLEKLQKQYKEAQEYDEKLAHIALSRIDIDLDDGVKVNYEKVQTGRDGQKLQILAKI